MISGVNIDRKLDHRYDHAINNNKFHGKSDLRYDHQTFPPRYSLARNEDASYNTPGRRIKSTTKWKTLGSGMTGGASSGRRHAWQQWHVLVDDASDETESRP